MNPNIAVLFGGLTVLFAIWAFFGPKKEASQQDTERDFYVDEQNLGARSWAAPLINSFAPSSPISTTVKGEERERLKNLLTRSGNPWNLKPNEFKGIQIIFAIIGTVVGLIVSSLFLPNFPAIILAAVLGTIGFLAPFSVYNSAQAARAADIQKQLPDALDLLVVIMRSGQNFEPALSAISEKMPDGVLKDEFIKVSSEINSGRKLEDALIAFANRAASEEAENFAKSVAQAQRLGADVSETLTAQAVSARENYENIIQKKTAKLSQLAFIVMIPTLFPALLIILLAPSMSSIGGVL